MLKAKLALAAPEEIVDSPAEVHVDMVPQGDDEHPVASYQDWNLFDSFIVTCRINNNLYKGRPFETRDQAIKAITAEYGRILEANYVPGRAFFRVRKP